MLPVQSCSIQIFPARTVRFRGSDGEGDLQQIVAGPNKWRVGMGGAPGAQLQEVDELQ